MASTPSASDIRRLLATLDPKRRAEIETLVRMDAARWRPLPGPQRMAYESAADVVGYGGAAGGGKGLALDTPIPTPAGWTTMRDVQPGDVLFDDRGQPCTVTGVSEIAHRPCYRLTFDDGSTLVADDVHRWVTFDASELSALTRKSPEWRAARRANRPSRAGTRKSAAFRAAISKRNAAHASQRTTLAPTGTMRDTATLAATLVTRTGRANHAIPVCGALFTPAVELPIPPYTLGAWLGDGSSASGAFACGKEDTFILRRIEADGYKTRSYVRNDCAHGIYGLKPQLLAIGVLGDKHIPAAYLRASLDQRLTLLQGLMDTDGHAAEDGRCEFTACRERLAYQVYELALSLGIKATIGKGEATLYGRVTGPKWRVTFTTQLPVFALPRKLARLPSVARRTTRMRYLVACDLVETVPTKCIAVDSESRQYLAGAAMIPTHNTALAVGKALTRHKRCAIFRREGTELTAIIDYIATVLGTRDGYNGQDRIWRLGDRQIEFGSVPNVGDESKYQGRPHDLIVFDEAANFLESQVRFLMGWVRTEDPAQRCQVLMTFNPPTSAEGQWVIRYFAPWLDPMHPKPAKPGELRWYAMVAGKETEMSDERPFVIVGGVPVHDFDPQAHRPEDIVRPMSRTFIPARVTDNPYYATTGYMNTLQSLPEPLRSQMLKGDFSAGMEDDPWQVIPTAWIEAAMARWKPLDIKPKMNSVGVDVARGGRDETVIMRRHGSWFDVPIALPGAQTPDGPAVAGQVLALLRDRAPVHIDVIGVGSSPYDFLVSNQIQAVGVNMAEAAGEPDLSGRLTFANMRSMLWWRMREALDPANNRGLALPNNAKLKADLCAPTWKLRGTAIQVESRDDIVRRIGRSPDYGTAAILALMDTPALAEVVGYRRGAGRVDRLSHDPFARRR